MGWAFHSGSGKDIEDMRCRLSSGRWKLYPFFRLTFSSPATAGAAERNFLLCRHAQDLQGFCHCFCNLIMHLIKEMKFLLRLFAHSRRWHRAFLLWFNHPNPTCHTCVLPFGLFPFAFSPFPTFPPFFLRIFPNTAVLFSHNFFECGLDLGTFTMRQKKGGMLPGIPTFPSPISQSENLHCNV